MGEINVADKETLDAVYDMVNEMASSGDTAGMIIAQGILSSDQMVNNWAFGQPGIGAVINDAFQLNSSALATCETTSQIAANGTALTAIASDMQAVICCQKDSILNAALASYADDEAIIASGMGYLKFEVGDIVQLTWNGAKTPFRVVDKNYITKNKIVLMSENILTTSTWHGSANNYSSSTLRSLLNGANILGKFSSAIQSAMVTSPVSCHNNTTAVTCNDKVWAASYTELAFATSQYAPAEGAPFEYFAGGGNRVKLNGGTVSVWWLRTPHTTSSTTAWPVTADGTSRYNNVSDSYGVVPVFEI